ncbi:hypothetical protein AYR57_08990 [Pediococcus claussenii]|uniref:Rqc2 family fibronectin-binding protein n=1 Tax=Pediococcus claussenii TaxID=187452 RepID=UPI00081A60DD|nr:NFACT RNA binding domain-containing protein [Pediococcus claussenii]ANZ70444.1 hypothetical protein AYR57_08990 [Pediococcus claussenii]
MPFDGMFTHAITQELNQELAAGRVAKINQPFDNELILTIRSNRKNKALLLSAHPNYSRIHLTTEKISNPATPSNFTMSLRKHLDGAILNQISQVENDRIVNLFFNHRNDLGDSEDLVLSIEIMGRRSNIILYESGSGRIIDLVRHISADQNRYRLLMPGAQYLAPPLQETINPFEDVNKTLAIVNELMTKYPNYETLAGEIRHEFQGFSRDTSLEFAYELVSRKESREQIIKDFLTNFDNPVPTLSMNDQQKYYFSPYEPTQLDNIITSEGFDSLSKLLDRYYLQLANQDRVKQRGKTLIRVVHNDLKRNKGKLKKLQQTLENTKRADEFRIKGEVLTTYLSQVERGMTSIELPNFYDNDSPLKIELSNQLSPSKNAQKYFTKYQKEKNAVTFVTKQIKLTKQEIDFLENIESQVELANPDDLDEIKIELENQGYIKQKTTKKKRVTIKSKPEKFISSTGTSILVGKNDSQNDRLTLHTADKQFYWLHAKDIPGSHVIIESKNPDETTVDEAALIAAYYSKAQNSANVPVDFVQVKNIRKPNGSKPGFVIYEGQKTFRTTPDLKQVLALKQ